MKKKILSLITALACASTCAVALVACGGGNDSKGGGTTTVNTTVTEAEWKDALGGIKFNNLTTTVWSYEEAEDKADVATNKNNAYEKVTFKAAQIDGYDWFLYDLVSINGSSNNEKYMFKDLNDSGAKQYGYLSDIAKWTEENATYDIMSWNKDNWKNRYDYNLLINSATNFADFTYVKSEKLYRSTNDFDEIDIKFQDKKVVSYTHKQSYSCKEITDIGTTVIGETPTTFATLAEDAIGKTFRLIDVVACEDNNDPSTDKPSTNQAALDMAAQFKTDNLNKTAVCEAQELDDVNMDGVLKGTCNFGDGAFDSLTGDSVLYWKAESVYLYSAEITVASKDNSVRLRGKYFADVLTLTLDLGNGNYLKLTYSL